MRGNGNKRGVNLPGVPGNTAGGRKPGTKNRASLIRLDAVKKIEDDWKRRDDKAVESGFASWLATLNDRDFLTLVKAIIPKNIDITGGGAAEVLNALVAKASEANG